jgi:hypothetical protein
MTENNFNFPDLSISAELRRLTMQREVDAMIASVRTTNEADRRQREADRLGGLRMSAAGIARALAAETATILRGRRAKPPLQLEATSHQPATGAWTLQRRTRPIGSQEEHTYIRGDYYDTWRVTMRDSGLLLDATGRMHSFESSPYLRVYGSDADPSQESGPEDLYTLGLASDADIIDWIDPQIPAESQPRLLGIRSSLLGLVR